MTARDKLKKIQGLLGLDTVDGLPGPKTNLAFGDLCEAARLEFRATGNASIQPLTPRRISDRGLALVKHFEGCYLKAYKDAVGVWTIGYGHTGLQHKDGTVHAGRTITQAQADELLRYDMGQFEARVIAFVKVPVNDDQFGALVSFDFNTGGLGRSTLLKRLNEGDYPKAADEFLKWDKAGGKVLRGLTRRRQSERNLFLGKAEYIVA